MPSTSLRRSVLVPLCACLAILLSLMAVVLTLENNKQAFELVRSRSALTANAISYAASTVYEVGELQRYVSAVGGQPEIESILVIDNQTNKVIASTQFRWRGKSIADLPLDLLPAGFRGNDQNRSGAHLINRAEQRSSYRESISIGRIVGDEIAEREGSVIVNFRLEDLEKQFIDSNVTYGLITGVSVLLVAIVCLYLIQSKVVAPISFIQKSINWQEGGKALDAALLSKIPNNEIGHLAQSLQIAFERAHNRTVEARQLAKDLQFQKSALDQHAIVSECDASGLITYANPKFRQISKYSREDLTGQNHRILNSGLHSQNFWSSLYQSISENGVWNGEIRNKAKDGSYFWLATTIVGFRGKERKITRYVSISTDITDRKNVEFELINANRAAERNLRTAEQAREEAEQAAAAKSQFLATMSHEIRTPMNGLIGVLHLIEEGLPPEKQKLLETANNSANDLLVLINDILDLSKIEAGKMQIEKRPIDFLNLIEHVCGIHAYSAHNKGLSLSMQCDPLIDYQSEGDPHRIRQIISNLISNAVKFTEKGSVQITLERQENSIHVSVADTGIGIPNEAMDDLFKSFSQVNSSTTRKFGGTGLGLSICKKLIELMGGKIDCESVANQGSTFWFELPAALPKSEREFPAEWQALRHANILIIAPESNERNYIERWLSAWQTEYQTSADPESARKIAPTGEDRDAAFDCVLIDESFVSPNSSRWEQLRKQFACVQKSRIIILHPLNHAPKRSSEHSKNEVLLAKPIRVDMLADALQSDEKRRLPIEKTASNETSEPDKQSRLKILLVDDNKTNLLIANHMLKQQLKTVATTASNGQEAIDTLKQSNFDLVLMDCMMPVLDGYSATRAIRDGKAGENNRAIPVIALTANAMEGDKEKCKASGMSDYLSKPLNPKQLTAVLNQWTTARHPLPETPQSSISTDERQDHGLINLTKLRDIYEDDDRTISQLLDLFITGMHECIQSLRKYSEESIDQEKLRFFAHRIKGSASEFGAAKLTQIAETMENHCVDDRIDDAIALIEPATEAVRQVEDHIAKIRLSH